MFAGTTEPYVGAHVIDQASGKRGQVVQLLGDGAVLVRLDDSTVSRARPG